MLHYIAKRMMQTHEDWETVQGNLVLKDSVARLQKQAAEHGWEYIFMSASDRDSFFRHTVRMVVVIDHDRVTQSDGMPFYKAFLVEEDAIWAKFSTGAGVPRPRFVELDARDKLARVLDVDEGHDQRKNVGSVKTLTAYPFSLLFDALDGGSPKSDFLRHSFVYFRGGCYLDVKAGVKEEDEFDLRSAVFGKDQERARAKMLLSKSFGPSINWVMRPDDPTLQSWDDYASQGESVEFTNWMVCAQKRHRFLFRVLEVMAFQLYMLGRFGTFKAYEVPDFSAPNRHMRMCLATGPFVFSNAITKEAERVLKGVGRPKPFCLTDSYCNSYANRRELVQRLGNGFRWDAASESEEKDEEGNLVPNEVPGRVNDSETGIVRDLDDAFGFRYANCYDSESGRRLTFGEYQALKQNVGYVYDSKENEQKKDRANKGSPNYNQTMSARESERAAARGSNLVR